MPLDFTKTVLKIFQTSSVPDFNDDNFIGFSLDECSSKSANANAAMIDSIADDDGQDHASSQNSGMRSEAHQHYL